MGNMLVKMFTSKVVFGIRYKGCHWCSKINNFINIVIILAPSDQYFLVKMATKGAWKPKISSKLPRLFTKRCFRSKGAFLQNPKWPALGNFFLFFTHNDRSWLLPKHFLLIYWHPQINISWSKWPPKVLGNQKFHRNCLISSPKGVSGQKEHFL